jgi:hypothetical protein
VKNVQAFSLGNIFPSILRARKIFWAIQSAWMSKEQRAKQVHV